MNRLLLVSCALAVLAAAGCGGKQSPSASPRATTAATGVRDLHNIEELRAAFNARRGQPRLILLISPT